LEKVIILKNIFKKNLIVKIFALKKTISIVGFFIGKKEKKMWY
jgi:hypothetical protein